MTFLVNSSLAVTYALLLVAMVIWGWTFVASKVCLELMSPLQLVASRFLIAAPALYIVARLRRVSFGYAELARPFALGALVFSTHFLLQNLGTRVYHRDQYRLDRRGLTSYHRAPRGAGFERADPAGHASRPRDRNARHRAPRFPR